MSHPDPHGAPDLTPIQLGEVWENPVTGERTTILELPYTNPEGRATSELTVLVGARVWHGSDTPTPRACRTRCSWRSPRGSSAM